ncbi:phytanoyl-CoA dioxygenase family protein [Tolypothrix bouteillei VB521301]|uniref:Phytanoyl-CoA dioxygenase family protein n=1 Tax=Tolypothrix bouteillei VB521301 TaxID=1479485 RepID=A0A8S9TFB6_9CYAN|nr:phytanoyl-CoA dioxygenase family protein [Tolypothrix bouteillei VB521301]
MANQIKRKVNDLQSELIYKTELIKYAGKVPVLEERDRKIVDALKTEGAYVTSLEELGISTTSTLLKASDEHLSGMLSVNQTGKTERLPQIYTMTDFPEFSQWGKEKRLLSIIENYIGLPIAFHGVHLRKDFPNENQFGTLLWHKDSEDRRIIKIIIYLTDVEEHHGPFEYIPLSLTSAPSLNYYRLYYKLWRSNYVGINDEQVQEIIPKKYWKSCPGPAGTVIFVDPRRALHHGTLRTQDRSALFFVYTANPPQRPELCTQYWDDTFPKPQVLCKN